MNSEESQTVGSKSGKFNMDNLVTRGVVLDHKSVLEQTARVLDEFRQSRPTSAHDGTRLTELKAVIAEATSVEDIVAKISLYPEALVELGRVVQDGSFEELLLISRAEGAKPLSDWPNSRSQNWFSEVCLQAVEKAPLTLAFILRIMVRSIEENVMPSHVVQTATLFAQMAEKVDSTNSALSKMNSLQLKFDGLTDAGLDAFSRLGLNQNSRSLKTQRDFFCEVSDAVALEEVRHMPEQSTLDNCCSKGHDCTVEFRQTETLKTNHLSTQQSSPEEVLSYFSLDMFLVTRHEAEFDHLRDEVVPLVVARLIAAHRPDVAGWLDLFPPHHRHSQSHQPLTPAKARLVAPHYYKVCKYSRTFIKNCLPVAGDGDQRHDQDGMGSSEGVLGSHRNLSARRRPVC